MTSFIINNSIDRVQHYLNSKPPLVQSCVSSFLCGAAVSLILSGGNPIVGLAGGAFSLTSVCVSAVALKAMKFLQDAWCDLFNELRRELSGLDNFVGSIGGLAITTAGACAIGLNINVPVTILFNLAILVSCQSRDV
jgi:hypothetical protein